MNKYLLEYCDYVQRFKVEHNILIVDNDFKIIYISSKQFFERYSCNFEINANLFECLHHLPYFETKQQIYDNLIQTKRVFGYFIAQKIDNSKGYLVDNIRLMPVLDPDKNLIGIELEAVDMSGLPLITLSNDDGLKKLASINLTTREREIIILKAMGKTNLDISKILGEIYQKEISQHTIANIIKQQIYIKLNVENKPAMIKVAHTLGLDKIIPKSLITENQLILFPTIS